MNDRKTPNGNILCPLMLCLPHYLFLPENSHTTYDATKAYSALILPNVPEMKPPTTVVFLSTQGVFALSDNESETTLLKI